MLLPKRYLLTQDQIDAALLEAYEQGSDDMRQEAYLDGYTAGYGDGLADAEGRTILTDDNGGN